MNKRKTLLIEPRFQVHLMLRLAGWVTLATALTGGVMFAFLAVADRRAAGDFFFVVREAGYHPVLLHRSDILLPALAVSLAVNLVLCLAFTLFYTQRLAGPLHRLRQEMLRLARGEKPSLPFRLRDADELQELANAFDTLLHSMERKRPSSP